MKYKINRDDEPKEAAQITVFVGLDRYRLSEDNEGKLVINKHSDGDTDAICINPSVTNEIKLS